jgi:S-adenosylmethionine:tRNA ribosyltransferase-isomerase
MKTSEFDYELPPHLIAQTPLEPRDSSRMLVLNKSSGKIQHTFFRDLCLFLQPGDLLVLNQTRVIPARLSARKDPTGGKVEILLLRQVDESTWETLVGGKGIKEGSRLKVIGGPGAVVVQSLSGPRRLVRFLQPLNGILEQVGSMPLPPYIHTVLKDPERYQTVYARQPGSAAAPTAGLHFTPGLLEQLQAQGIGVAYVTLHVGLDTFSPVTEDLIEDHPIHKEWCQVSDETARLINQARRDQRRIVAVGTTTVRTLESAAQHAPPGDVISPWDGSTDLFILPGYTFRVVDVLITNFHLPRSTLIMLVSAFAGRDQILAAYQTAIEQNYRFYSFGDAMLIR